MSSSFPTKKITIQTFDVETLTDWKTLRMVGLFNECEGYRWYKTIDEAIDDMAENGGIWYAHNGGKFDFRFFYEPLKLRYNLKFLFRNGRFYRISIYRKTKSKKMVFQIRDSFNLLMASLDSLAKTFKCETLKGNVDYDKAAFSELAIYNEKDCKALFEILTKFQDLCPNGMALTIASQAQRDFKAAGGHYQDVRRDYQFDKDYRRAYYGGRVECFKKEAKEVNYYDINSSYAKAMCNDFPVGKMGFTKNYLKYHGIYFVHWKKPKGLLYGVLPARNTKGSLVFSYLEAFGWYCTPELRKAHSLGYRIEVVKGYGWRCTRPIFAPVVKAWYKKKAASKGAMREYYKRLLNSLYGRLGLREETEEVIDRLPTQEEVRKYDVLPLNDECTWWTYKRRHFFPNVYVQLAAFITSYARVQLYEMMEGKEVFYCDTDSITTPSILPASNEMGGYKFETSGDFIGLAPKLMLLYKGRRVLHLSAKGFDRSKLTLDLFKAALQGDFEKFTTITTRPMGLKTCMIKGVSFISTSEMVRSFKGKDDKNNFPPMGSILPMKEKIKKPPNLISWLRDLGGIYDPSIPGEVAEFSKRESGIVGLLSKKGLPFDELVGEAVNDGWLNEGATGDDFRELLRRDIFALRFNGERAKNNSFFT